MKESIETNELEVKEWQDLFYFSIGYITAGLFAYLTTILQVGTLLQGIVEGYIAMSITYLVVRKIKKEK